MFLCEQEEREAGRQFAPLLCVFLRLTDSGDRKSQQRSVRTRDRKEALRDHKVVWPDTALYAHGQSSKTFHLKASYRGK